MSRDRVGGAEHGVLDHGAWSPVGRHRSPGSALWLGVHSSCQAQPAVAPEPFPHAIDLAHPPPARCSQLGGLPSQSLQRGDSVALSAVSAESPRMLQLRVPPVGVVRRVSSAHAHALQPGYRERSSSASGGLTEPGELHLACAHKTPPLRACGQQTPVSGVLVVSCSFIGPRHTWIWAQGVRVTSSICRRRRVLPATASMA